VFVEASNAGSSDVYQGGTGTDTLEFNFTAAEYTAAVALELGTYSLSIGLDTGFGASEATPATFSFDEIGLTAGGVEGFDVYVDGVFVGDEASFFPF
jgi:hypothetical protein